MDLTRILQNRLFKCASIRSRDKIFHGLVVCRFALEDGTCLIGSELGHGSCEYLISRKDRTVRRK